MYAHFPVYSYFMATLGTVKLLSRGSGEALGNLQEAEGQWFDCSQSSLEITVLLLNSYKSPNHCQ